MNNIQNKSIKNKKKKKKKNKYKINKILMIFLIQNSLDFQLKKELLKKWYLILNKIRVGYKKENERIKNKENEKRKSYEK